LSSFFLSMGSSFSGDVFVSFLLLRGERLSPYASIFLMSHRGVPPPCLPHLVRLHFHHWRNLTDPFRVRLYICLPARLSPDLFCPFSYRRACSSRVWTCQIVFYRSWVLRFPLFSLRVLTCVYCCLIHLFPCFFSLRPSEARSALIFIPFFAWSLLFSLFVSFLSLFVAFVMNFAFFIFSLSPSFYVWAIYPPKVSPNHLPHFTCCLSPLLLLSSPTSWIYLLCLLFPFLRVAGVCLPGWLRIRTLCLPYLPLRRTLVAYIAFTPFLLFLCGPVVSSVLSAFIYWIPSVFPPPYVVSHSLFFIVSFFLQATVFLLS